MKELLSCDSRFEANVIAQVLDEHDIPYVIQANDAGGMFPTSADPDAVKILVSEDDFLDASRLMQE